MRSHLRGKPFASRAVRATRGSNSLRVTIPQVVAATLGLRAGDELLWHIDRGSGDVHVEVERSQPAAGPPGGRESTGERGRGTPSGRPSPSR
jgi:hypothetical protein